MLVILLTMLPMGGVELPDFVYRALPVPVVLLGALICFYGRKARRLYALTLGVTVGTIVIHEVLPSNTSGLGSTWALVFLCALGIAIAGVLCVLIRQVAAGAALGAILGLLAAIGAHRLHFGWVRDEFLVVLDVVFIVVLTLVAVGKPTSTMMASSAMSGGLAIVAAADHFMSGRFLAYVAHQVRDGMQSDDFVGMSFDPALIAGVSSP